MASLGFSLKDVTRAEPSSNSILFIKSFYCSFSSIGLSTEAALSFIGFCPRNNIDLLLL